MGAVYDRDACERALARLRHDPIALDDADFAALAVIGREDDARAMVKAAIMAPLPTPAPVVTKATPPPRTRRQDIEAERARIIGDFVAAAITPLAERIAALEADNAALRDRVALIEAAVKVPA
jgi:hypothetical protein